ncbi:type VII secretion-associated serine protease mycosin [Nocardia wallacei]|uniref:type VII secretion-associated serine protease mycosin n=1 Tax=Nocardia wallacei TaxID=480035 RepID=UPI0024574EAB|nr:type VII secretion-associated serine protease mycosin [Nocardia wallacei]
MTSNRLGRSHFRVLRTVAATSVLALSATVGFGATGPGVAYAGRPVVDPGPPPSGGSAAPLEATERPANAACLSTGTGGDGAAVPPAQAALDLPAAWAFSKGAGQLIAVIDTGVARHPRLPGLIPGGDYVSQGDGTEDCDAHGTLVAGLIAATEEPGQGFAGVAPEAQILAIRQQSKLYQRKGAGQDKPPDALPDAYGSTETMARAIVRAADMGARVINISEVACKPVGQTLVDRTLGAAIRYAVDEKDVVIVTAAGNKEGDCKNADTVIDPLDPAGDPWDKMKVDVSPAHFDDYVLSVGSIDANGQPSKFTVPGPWVGVAAPGENIVSLDPLFDSPGSRGTVVNTANQQGQLGPVQGTSFASPYVAGVAALVRSRFPELSAPEVIKRIEATAHAPAEGWNPYIGYGAVDPVAALTAEVPNQLPPKRPSPAKSIQLAVPKAPPPTDNTARNVALIGTGVIAVLLTLGYLASFPIRRKLGVHEDR